MKLVKRDTVAFVLCVVAILAIGCTWAEVQETTKDAVKDAPAALVDIVTNPTPSNIGAVVLVYIAGLVSKSAARGFGKGAKYAKSGVAATVGAIANAILSVFGRKK